MEQQLQAEAEHPRKELESLAGQLQAQVQNNQGLSHLNWEQEERLLEREMLREQERLQELEEKLQEQERLGEREECLREREESLREREERLREWEERLRSRTGCWSWRGKPSSGRSRQRRACRPCGTTPPSTTRSLRTMSSTSSWLGHRAA